MAFDGRVQSYDKYLWNMELFKVGLSGKISFVQCLTEALDYGGRTESKRDPV